MSESALSFDLVDEPWIEVLGVDGRIRLVSLRQMLIEADNISTIAGEVPTMTTALHRLAIAVLHRAAGPVTPQRWRSWWDTGLPIGLIEEYLDLWRHRFNLFDHAAPYGQCPALAGMKPTTAALLVPTMASGNNTTLYNHTTADTVVTLTAAQAARWLITLQQADLGGLKTPYDPGGKEPKGPRSAYDGPCARGMVLLLYGATLAETLLLNAGGFGETRDEGDLPVWERLAPGGMPVRRAPTGPIDWLTWPSRRILLHGHLPEVPGGQPIVREVTICAGDVISSAELVHDVEPHMALRENVRNARGAVEVGGPLKPRLSRALWRDSTALLADIPPHDGGQDGAVRGKAKREIVRPARAPVTFAWARQHLAGGILPVLALGQAAEKSKMIAYLNEQATLPLGIAEDPIRQAQLSDALSLAEAAGDLLTRAWWWIRGSYKTSLEVTEERRRRPVPTALDSYWAGLTPQFDQLVTGLAAGQADAAQRWRSVVRQAAGATVPHVLAAAPAGAAGLLIKGRTSSWLDHELRKLTAQEAIN